MSRELIPDLGLATVKNGALYIDGGMESFVPLINGTQPWQNASLQMGYST